jgi:hypothetical protein
MFLFTRTAHCLTYFIFGPRRAKHTRLVGKYREGALIPISSYIRTTLVALAFVALAPHCAFASDQDRCPTRPAAGSGVTPPPDLFSQNGLLSVVFHYFTTVDSNGRTLFCLPLQANEWVIFDHF